MFGATAGARPQFAWSWLDHGVVSAALRGVRGPVLVADPAADLALGLLAHSEAEVVWVTASTAAFALADLKVRAVAELPVEGCRILLGLELGGRRVFFYHLLRKALSEPARLWWDRREALVREGVARCGAFERLLERLRERGPAGVAARALRRVSGEALARAAELDSAWGEALSPRGEGALARAARRGDPEDLAAAWPIFSREGHAAITAGRARLSLRLSPLAEALGERPWGAVVLGASGDLGPAAGAIGRLPSGCRLLGWAGRAPTPRLDGLVDRPDLSRGLSERDGSLLGGLWVADRFP